MTSQVEFFCTRQEERSILAFLIASASVQVFLLEGGRMQEWKDFSPDDLPRWPASVHLYLWNTELGPLRWHQRPPKVTGATHGALVARLLAREAWDRLSPNASDRMLGQRTVTRPCVQTAEDMAPSNWSVYRGCSSQQRCASWGAMRQVGRSLCELDSSSRKDRS